MSGFTIWLPHPSSCGGSTRGRGHGSWIKRLPMQPPPFCAQRSGFSVWLPCPFLLLWRLNKSPWGTEEGMVARLRSHSHSLFLFLLAELDEEAPPPFPLGEPRSGIMTSSDIRTSRFIMASLPEAPQSLVTQLLVTFFFCSILFFPSPGRRRREAVVGTLPSWKGDGICHTARNS